MNGKVHDAELRDLLGDAKFSSVTYRVFKVAEDRRIKDGRVVTYNGKFEDGKSGYRVSADVTLLGEHPGLQAPGMQVRRVEGESHVQRFPGLRPPVGQVPVVMVGSRGPEPPDPPSCLMCCCDGSLRR